MNQRTLVKLEFNKVVDLLAGCCASSLGKELAQQLQPSLDAEEIKAWQSETTEGREMLRLHPDVPFGGIFDVRLALKRVEVGGVLAPEDLMSLVETLFGGRRLKQFILETKEEIFPTLRELAGGVGNFRPLEEQINRCILPGGEIADSASEELLKIRRQKRVLQNRVKEKIDQVLRGADWQKMLQENIVTVRGDRYVVPVKQEYRSQFPGIVHDQSSSGATLFIEPLGVVEVNNELRSLARAEEQEIAAILRGLSESVRSRLEELTTTIDNLARLDFIFAKARLSLSMKAWEPKLNSWGYLNIIKGRHPLISGDVVPVSIYLGGDFSTLIITGPNTGGKTVTLKTVGLFVLMAQAGLHIPAEHGSEIGLYHKIFTDIGDEQSIEQSLSTFSSHMKNIVDILSKADVRTLVLVDELGAGTDPSEGAALAMAILEELFNRGSKTIATTHYSELKNFAYSRAGMENASVEFDTATLRPTYRLLIGQPGRSNAFEIAARLGLDSRIVEAARGYQSEEEREFANLLENLEETQKDAQAQWQAAAEAHEESDRLRDEYRRLQERLSAQRETIITKARAEALEIVKAARQETEQIVESLKSELARETGQNKLNLAHRARGRLRSLQAESGAKLNEGPEAPGQVPQQVRPGQVVLVARLNQKGTVISRAAGSGDVLVQVGIMKISVPLQDLRTVTDGDTDGPGNAGGWSGPGGGRPGAAGGGQGEGGRGDAGRQPNQTGRGGLMADKARSASRELDLRGLKVDEALYQMDKYLDNAILAGLPSVYLIHGKGTGALRAAVKEALAAHPAVKSYRLGEYGEGGDGVTLVEFKGGGN